MTPFRERNPVTIGAVGLGLIVLLLVAAFNIQDLPLIGSGTTYTAAFTEAGGLKAGDEVRVAGVKVGKVDSLDLEGDHVRVGFRVEDGTHFGTETGASIRIKTILGSKYLSLEPKGGGQLSPGTEIPLGRTVSAYDVVQAFSDLATTNEQIDTTQLAAALDTVSATFKDSPAEVKASLNGLSRLSTTVSSRDTALRDLLTQANGVTAVLSDRSAQLTTLINDGDALFAELESRRQVIHTLLLNTSALAVQLSGLVNDNRQQIGPALNHLGSVLDVLQRNQDSLDRSIRLLGPFVRVFANNLGNGRWFDTYVQNLVAAPVAPQGGPSVHTPPGGSR